MLKHKFKNLTVFQNESFDLNQDWDVPIPGFVILSPKRKLRSISDFTNEEAIEFINILRKVRTGMSSILGIKDVYLFQNEDTKDHFHLWIFPRLPWMEKFGRKIESVKPIMDYAEKNMQNQENIDKIKQYVNKLKQYMSQEKITEKYDKWKT